MNVCMKQARGGDAAAIDAVARKLSPRLTKMAVYFGRRTGDDPDDLLQEAWCGLLAAIQEVDPASASPETYLVARARWRMLDAARRSRLRRCFPLDALPMRDLSTPCHSEKTVNSIALGQFASRLRPTQRDVLSCLLAGLTMREAGAALGCTAANIAYHVTRIRLEYQAWKDEG